MSLIIETAKRIPSHLRGVLRHIESTKPASNHWHSGMKVVQHLKERPSGLWNVKNILSSCLLFAPSKQEFPLKRLKETDHEEVFIDTPDGNKLHGYFLFADRKSDKVAVFLHGNDFNVSRWYLAPLAMQKEVPVNFLVFDYRGYGKSTGFPTFKGVVMDTFSAYDHLVSKGYKPDNISLYGRSMGGAAAVELASRTKVRSVVLQSTLTTFPELINYHMPYLPNLFIQDNWFNLKRLISRVDAPVLISNGDQDDQAPVHFAHELHEVASDPKKLIILEGARHGSLSKYFTDEYYDWLQKHFL